MKATTVKAVQQLAKHNRDAYFEVFLHTSRDSIEILTEEQAKPTPAPVEVDGDVSLFAALMAHLQGQPEDKGTALTKQLEKCRLLDAIQAEQCRAQACVGIAKTEKAWQRTETTPAAKGTSAL